MRRVYNIKELLLKAFAKDDRKQHWVGTERVINDGNYLASQMAVYSRLRRAGYVGSDELGCALPHKL